MLSRLKSLLNNHVMENEKGYEKKTKTEAEMKRL